MPHRVLAIREPQSVVTGEEVRRQELEQIALRRREAFDLGRADETPETVQRNLVGLALSGGGVRSGAFSLGLLQALHRRGVLRFVDYLSTVSGGGYAGAYLSSVALRRSRACRAQAAAQANFGNRPAPANIEEDLFPEPPDDSPRASRPLLRFIHGGNYLRHWWKFFNRYLIGLALILTVVISGLLALASLTAYLFRSLDHVEVRDWLTALGFRDDLTQTFFPTFVLGVLWLGCWTVSYFKFGGRATGVAARSLFYALVFVTATAIAVLLVTGNISLASFERAWGRSPNEETVGSITKAVWVAVLTVIVVGLLPYLSPQRLIRSGASPRGAVEKYAFWIASRALVFGVPFLLIAFFARENFSHWNSLRDDRLALSDLEGHPEPWPPFFQQIHREANALGRVRWLSTAAATIPAGQPVLVWPIAAILNAAAPTPGAYLWGGRSSNDVSLTLRFMELQRTHPELLESELGAGWLNNFDDPARAERSLTDADHDLTFWSRWVHLAVLPGEALLRERPLKNPLWGIVEGRRKDRRLKREIMYIVNCRLLTPRFYEYFDLPRLRKLYPGRPEADWDKLERLKAEAAQLEHALGLTAAAQTDFCDPCLTPLTKTDRTPEDEQRVQLIHNRSESEHPQFNANEHKDLEALLPATPEQLRPNDSFDSYIARHPNDHEPLRRSVLQQERVQRAVLSVNRKLLAALYGDSIRPKTRVTSYVALSKDQEARWSWFLWSVGVFLAAGLLVDLNATSLHGFYAGQISRMWTEDAPGLGRDIPLPQLETVEAGKPYHLISGSLHLVGRRNEEWKERSCESFLFSRMFCGSDRVGFVRTEEWMGGQYRLADAIAVSGGAVSPTQIPNPLVAVLLILANIRLGQWVANPAYRCRTAWGRVLWFGWPITPLRFLLRLAQRAEQRPFIFVADGGHYENLGIEPLLKRRCRLIIASDAGMDRDYQFADFMRLLRWSRIMHGVQFVTTDGGEPVISLDQLVPHKVTRRSRSHHLVVKIKYPPTEGAPRRADGGSAPEDVGYLIYVKSSLKGDEPPDLLRYRDRNPEFPHDSTADQFFDPERFESYRQLGEKIGLSLCAHLVARPREEPSQAVDDFIAEFVGPSEFPTRIGPPKLLPVLEETADETGADPEARGTERDLAMLCDGSADPQERVLAAERLGACEKPTHAVVEALLAAAADPDESLAKAAIHALPELGSAAVPFLSQSLAASTDNVAQQTVIETLQEVFRRQAPGTLITVDQALAERLMIIAVVGAASKRRCAALEALAELRRWLAPSSEPTLHEAIHRVIRLAAAKDRSSRVRQAAKEALHRWREDGLQSV